MTKPAGPAQTPTTSGEMPTEASLIALSKPIPEPLGLDHAYHNRGVVYREVNTTVAFTSRNTPWADAYNNRAKAYLREHDRALQDFDRAIRLNDAKIHINRELAGGLAHLHEGDQDGAIQAFAEAIRLDPKNSGAYNLRALAYLDRGEFDQALHDLDEAIRITSDSSEAHYVRGLVYAEKGEHSRARRDLNKALALDYDRAKVEAALDALPD